MNQLRTIKQLSCTLLTFVLVSVPPFALAETFSSRVEDYNVAQKNYNSSDVEATNTFLEEFKKIVEDPYLLAVQPQTGFDLHYLAQIEDRAMRISSLPTSGVDSNVLAFAERYRDYLLEYKQSAEYLENLRRQQQRATNFVFGWIVVEEVLATEKNPGGKLEDARTISQQQQQSFAAEYNQTMANLVRKVAALNEEWNELERKVPSGVRKPAISWLPPSKANPQASALYIPFPISYQGKYLDSGEGSQQFEMATEFKPGRKTKNISGTISPTQRSETYRFKLKSGRILSFEMDRTKPVVVLLARINEGQEPQPQDFKPILLPYGSETFRLSQPGKYSLRVMPWRNVVEEPIDFQIGMGYQYCRTRTTRPNRGIVIRTGRNSSITIGGGRPSTLPLCPN